MTEKKGSVMSIEDRLRNIEDLEAVRLLTARYHQMCDGWDAAGTDKDPKAIAELFTEDGVWNVLSHRHQPPAQGRAAIEAQAKALQSIYWILHCVVNPVVEIDGDSAGAEFEGFVRVPSPESSSDVFWLVGITRRCVDRTLDGWRFRSLDWET